jgi:crotonobetainyl-CoA:carnitine CoA-transferase CaiB-like acyl-CoA transferase
MSGVLDGIKVIECTSHSYQGAVAGMMLGELGADVIQVEEAGHGNPLRGLQAFSGISIALPNGSNTMFELGNRDKRSMSLDIKKEEGRKILYQLVAKADVFLTSFRGDALRRLKLDYDTLSQYNEGLIYAHGSGLGQDGPDSQRAVHDYIGQARSGFMSRVGEKDSPPQYFNVAVGDQMGGIMLAYGVLAALVARERHGIGQEVHASQLGSLIFLQADGLGFSVMTGQSRPKSSRALNSPLWNHYECKDGKWIALGTRTTDRHWHKACRALLMEELEDDPRFSTSEQRRVNRDALRSHVAQTFATRDSDEWLERLYKYVDFPFSLVKEYSDVAEDPQVLANDYIIEYDYPGMGKMRTIGYPVRLSKTPLAMRSPAPEFAQHTEEILLENGYSWAEIGELKEQGIV